MCTFTNKRPMVVAGIVLSLSVTGCADLHSPLHERDVAAFSARLLTDAVIDPVQGPLTVTTAVARARSVNASVRAREIEAAFAVAKADGLRGTFLPKLTGETKHQWRTPASASRSSSNSTYSTSSDASLTDRALRVSWSPLDLGLSYIRASQGYDKAQQKYEDLRRSQSRVAEETRQVFWRCVALNVLMDAMAKMRGDVDNALNLIGKSQRDSEIDPMTAISLERDILATLRDISQLEVTLAPARGQLASLIHAEAAQLSSSLTSDLDVSARRGVSPAPLGQVDLERALRQRPEIRQVMYDLRISANDVDAVVLQVLPTPSLDAASASDSNSYLRHNSWRSGSMSLAVNLSNLLRLASEIETAELQRHVHRQLAVVTAASIIMQVRSAEAHVSSSEQTYKSALRIRDTHRKLVRQVSMTVRAGKATAQVLVRERLVALLADVRLVLAYGEWDTARAALIHAMGDDHSRADGGPAP